MSKRDSGSFSWNESTPGEPADNEGLPTEVADSLPTVRQSRSSDGEVTHRDIKPKRNVDPFSLTLDDAGATRLDLEEKTLPPIRAPSMRLVAPSLPERPPPPAALAAPAAPKTPAPRLAAEAAPTEPELDPPPMRARRRASGSLTTIVLAVVVSLLLLVSALLIWYSGSPDTVIADPPSESR